MWQAREAREAREDLGRPVLCEGSGIFEAASSLHARRIMQWTTMIPPEYSPLFGTLLFLASAVWIGTLLSVSWLCGRSRFFADEGDVGRLAVSLQRRWSTPALAVGLVTGAAWAVSQDVMRLHWFLGSLVFVVALLALHARVGAQARAVATGSLRPKGGGVQRLALLVSLGAIVALVAFRAHIP
jgi:hypothetical protein